MNADISEFSLEPDDENKFSFNYEQDSQKDISSVNDESEVKRYRPEKVA